jgi:hypothetical protein
MTDQLRRVLAFTSLSLLLGVATALPATPNQGGPGTNDEGNLSLLKGSVPLTREAVSLLTPISPRPMAVSLNGDEIVAQLLLHNQRRDAQLKRYRVVRTYEVRNHKGDLSAQEVVRMQYLAPDKKSFQKSSEEGSGTVRRMVFDRLMKSEAETATGQEHHDSALTPANYTFTKIGVENLGQYHCYVVETTPKRKDKYLFEGTIWIDTQDFAVVKIAGHPAKKLSFWIERADFVREYQKIGDFWLPYRDETTVHVRLFGEKHFTIAHDQYSINSDIAPMADSTLRRAVQP